MIDSAQPKQSTGQDKMGHSAPTGHFIPSFTTHHPQTFSGGLKTSTAMVQRGAQRLAPESWRVSEDASKNCRWGISTITKQSAVQSALNPPASHLSASKPQCRALASMQGTSCRHEAAHCQGRGTRSGSCP